MRVSKWGNSLAVRLPVSLVRERGLREGENVDIDVRKPANGRGSRARNGGTRPVDAEREASRLRLLARLQKQRPDGAARTWSREDLYTGA
jgi:antitoxin component of MazEF toxin-antitoxin module